jgi:hemerythrin-like domain-containing protein
MEALASLVREHQFITRLVTALESCARRVGRGADVDPADVRRFARALRQYADELHREKEEHVLLPFLARQGFDWDASPLLQVREEHSQERDLIAALDHAGARLERWTGEERRHVAGVASSLCELQRRHHQRENDQLFPAVILRLDAEALHRLKGELDRFDQNPMHIARRAAASDLGGELIARYAELDSAEP